MVRRFILYIVFVLSFCFPVSSIAAEANKKISVFGVTLGETFAAAGMNECKIKKIDSLIGKDYDFNDTDCYKHKIIGKTSCLTFIEKKLSFLYL